MPDFMHQKPQEQICMNCGKAGFRIFKEYSIHIFIYYYSKMNNLVSSDRMEELKNFINSLVKKETQKGKK